MPSETRAQVGTIMPRRLHLQGEGEYMCGSFILVLYTSRLREGEVAGGADNGIKSCQRRDRV